MTEKKPKKKTEKAPKKKVVLNSSHFKPGNKISVGNSGQPPQIYTPEWLSNEAKLFKEWMEKPDSYYFNSFAIERGYSPQRFPEFAEKSPEFAETLKIAKQWQQSKLVTSGLKNETNASITKFVLQNCHGWAERQQISGDANNPIAFLLETSDGKSSDLVNE